MAPKLYEVWRRNVLIVPLDEAIEDAPDYVIANGPEQALALVREHCDPRFEPSMVRQVSDTVLMPGPLAALAT